MQVKWQLKTQDSSKSKNYSKMADNMVKIDPTVLFNIERNLGEDAIDANLLSSGRCSERSNASLLDRPPLNTPDTRSCITNQENENFQAQTRNAFQSNSEIH